MFSSLVNFNSKALYVAVKPLEDAVTDSYEKKVNGLVFDPMYDRTHTGADSEVREFFESGHNIEMIPVLSEQGPGELAKTLAREYGIQVDYWVGGMTAPIGIPEDRVEQLKADLRSNPMKYFASREKKLFA